MDSLAGTWRARRAGTFPAIGSPAGNRLDAMVTALMSGPGGLLMLVVSPLVPERGLMTGAGIAALLVGGWAWCTPGRAPMVVRHAYSALSVLVAVTATAAAEMSTALRLGLALLILPVLVVACLRRARHAIPQLVLGVAVYSAYLCATVPPAAAVVGVVASGVTLAMVSTMAMMLRGSLDRVVQGLQVQAERDPLTGLLNRQGLRQAVQGEGAGGAGVVIMMDLDHFKRVNDEYGHQEGDDTLIWFAGLLTRWLRPGDGCARLGGEEFVVVRPGATADEAACWADEVRAAVAVEGRSRRAPITVSAGVADGALDDMTAVMKAADEALYRAKAGGRDRVERAATLVRAAE